MEHLDTLIHAAYVIPVEPAGVVWEQYSVALHNGRIHDVLPTAQARVRYSATTTRDLPGHALIPGLVNAHTHAAMTLFRGLADDLPLMVWLNNHIWPAEAAHVGAQFVADGTQLAIAEMLRGGTTCFNDMYFFPEETARMASACGMRAMVGLILIDFPTAWATGPDEYLRKGLALHDHLRDHPLIRTAFAPHAPYTVSDAPLERVRILAHELDIPVHMHIHETVDEVQHGVANYGGRRPLQRLDELGMLGPPLMAVHMTQLDDTEIARYAASGAHVVHCPESNLKLASGFCPVARLLTAGVNVGLGTDGAASNNDLDMFSEMRSAALLAKAVAQDAAVLPAAAALHMATLGGARAMGWDDEIGSLLPGKAADLVAVQLDTLESQPMYHPISQLVYATGRHQVTDVWVAGHAMLRQRVLTGLDEVELMAKARHWRDRVQQGVNS